MKYLLNTLIYILAAVVLTACGGRVRSVSEYGEELYSPRYSEGFSIYGAGDSSSVLVIRNPWQGAEGVVTELFLSRGGEKAPAGFTGQSVAVPLRKVVCLSSSHVAYLDALGELDAVAGVSGARYISNPVISERYASGKVKDVGYDTNINYELLAGLRPDLVFVYGVGGENTALTAKMHELGIKTLYIGEYLEDSPLGKAEWVVPFGEMFGKRTQAESIFGGIASRYEGMKEQAALLEGRPKVMLNSPYRDVWFVPGDRSYMVTLINDSGGEYIFAGEDSSVSRPVSGEAAYMAVSEADVWLNPNQARTIKELVGQNPKFGNIPVVKNRRVYNATRRSTDSGGSDFWESGTLHADRVLEDMIMIMHPGWNLHGELYYFERLE